MNWQALAALSPTKPAVPSPRRSWRQAWRRMPVQTMGACLLILGSYWVRNHETQAFVEKTGWLAMAASVTKWMGRQGRRQPITPQGTGENPEGKD